MRVNVLQENGYPQFGRSTLTVEDAIQRTGITHVLMAGGLPLTRETLEAMPSACRILCKWSLHRHSGERGIELDEPGCLAALRDAKDIAALDPRVEGFLIDDFSTGTINAGVTGEHLARLQQVNAAEHPQLPLLGTVYTMSLDRPQLPQLLPYFAAFLTPLWHAAEIERFRADVSRLAEMSGGKPQLLCIYLHDFGNNRPLTHALMARQLEVATQLLTDQKAVGLVILGTCMMDLDWEANHCFSEWLATNGNTPL
jgi:hypothetical protein